MSDEIKKETTDVEEAVVETKKETAETQNELFSTIEDSEKVEQKPGTEEGKSDDSFIDEMFSKAEASDESKQKTEKPKTHSEFTKAARLSEKEREKRAEQRSSYLSVMAGLKTASVKNSIIKAMCVGVDLIEETRVNTKEKYMVTLALLINDNYICRIPFDEIYRDNPIDPATVGRGRDALVIRQTQMARKFKGQEVDFCVTHVNYNPNDFTNYVVLGSRRKALLKAESYNFKHNPVEEGTFVDATIVSLSKHGALVNVMGVDTSIQMRDMTFRFVTDLEKEFRPGQQIKVYVLEVKKNPNGTHSLKVSAKEIELEIAKERAALLGVNTETDMVITSLKTDQRGNLKMLGWLPYYSMPALAIYAPTNAIWNQIGAGRIVRVRITHSFGNGMIGCICTGIEEAGVLH